MLHIIHNVALRYWCQSECSNARTHILRCHCSVQTHWMLYMYKDYVVSLAMTIGIWKYHDTLCWH